LTVADIISLKIVNKHNRLNYQSTKDRVAGQAFLSASRERTLQTTHPHSLACQRDVCTLEIRRR
jgi:predicted ferric reductase